MTLTEFSIGVDPVTVPAGSVTFEVTNEGPADVHEFVLFSTELGLTELPTLEDGTVDETGAGVELVDEIEDIAVGDTQALTVDLEAGPYVVICNISEEHMGELEVHNQEGRASLGVRSPRRSSNSGSECSTTFVREAYATRLGERSHPGGDLLPSLPHRERGNPRSR